MEEHSLVEAEDSLVEAVDSLVAEVEAAGTVVELSSRLTWFHLVRLERFEFAELLLLVFR